MELDKKTEHTHETREPSLGSDQKIGDGTVPRVSFPSPSPPVFVVEDSFFRSRTPKSTHWSIAWSDLMMTMFILFLTLFIYQMAHQEFLNKTEIEIVAGDVIAVPPPSTTAFPFYPISPEVSQNKTQVLKKVERVDEEVIVQQRLPEDADIPVDIETTERVEEKILPKVVIVPELIEKEEAPRIEISGLVESDSFEPAPLEESQDPAPKPQTAPPLTGAELITEMYDLSKVTLESEKLERFASVELIPDKTMRIILTGDLLFESGQAELTESAKQSLQKLAPIIRQTPYMINVVGHTDSVPMHSARFATNWELSVARASQVARFMIENFSMSGNQFVVSGFSYYRPVKPNTSAANKKANRRVEIILSKELPGAQTASSNNIQ